MKNLYELLIKNEIELKIKPISDKSTLAFIFSKGSKVWSIQADLEDLEKQEESVYKCLQTVLNNLINGGYYENT